MIGTYQNYASPCFLFSTMGPKRSLDLPVIIYYVQWIKAK